jgi:DNA-binding response OmpR family regulator
MKILLVEDEMAIAMGYADHLRSAGHEVDCVVTRDSALRKLISTHYDAAAIDLVLPGCTGDSVAEAAHLKRVGVVLMSASHAGLEDYKQTLEMKGCRVHAALRKPIPAAVLRLALEAAAREVKERAEGVEGVIPGGRS